MKRMMTLLAVCAVVLAGTLNAGEDAVMAMRGNPPDGVKPQNMLTMVWPGGVGEVPAQSPAEKAASKVEEPLGNEARVGPEGYFRWRDGCVRAPVLVAGRSLELDVAVDFGRTPRFVEQAADDSTGFFASLLKELAPK